MALLRTSERARRDRGETKPSDAEASAAHDGTTDFDTPAGRSVARAAGSRDVGRPADTPSTPPRTRPRRRIVRGSRQKRLLSEAVQLEEEAVPRFLRPALALIGLLVAGMIAWAAYVDVTEVTAAPGEVVPSGSLKVVQHPTGGVVEAIMVEPRELVTAGQPLLRLDADEAKANVAQLESRRAALELRAERLEAFAQGREPSFEALASGYPKLVADQREIWRNQVNERESRLEVLDQQIAQRRQELQQQRDALAIARRQAELAGRLLTMREQLAANELMSQVQVMETRRAATTAEGEVTRLENEINKTQTALEEARSRRSNVASRLRQEALAEMGKVNAELAEVETKLARAKTVLDRLELRAPVRGLVQNLKVTTRGEVIEPSQTVMQIVPVDDTLEAKVRIPARDIGHVEAGQDVTVKVSSYTYTRFGSIDGTLRKVSASSLVQKDGEAPFYRGWVELNKAYVGKDPGQQRVLPGMSVQADIVTGEKTLLEYLVKPIADAVDAAFHER